MGSNSLDALESFMRMYLSQYLGKCKVVGECIVTPDRYDITAGGHKLPALPCAFCGHLEGHAGEECPNLARDGTPDFKRGQ